MGRTRAEEHSGKEATLCRRLFAANSKAENPTAAKKKHERHFAVGMKKSDKPRNISGPQKPSEKADGRSKEQFNGRIDKQRAGCACNKVEANDNLLSIHP